MFAYVGTRTTKERNARGKGISIFDVDAISGDLTLRNIVGDLVNPSFLAINKDKKCLYTIHGDGDQISSFSIDEKTGNLLKLNSISTQGKNPVHLALNKGGTTIVVSNHITSSIAVISINQDGSLGEVTQLITLEGKPGPHRVEQPFSKPHFNPFSPCGNYVVVPDKGLDKVFVFRFVSGKLVPCDSPSVEAREVSGPRSAVFHPSSNFLYVVNELDSTVTVYQFEIKSGQLKPIQIIGSLPETFTGNSRASHIAINKSGTALYASNRGSDTLVVYRINPQLGTLETMQHISSHGRTPRFFTLSPDEKKMYVLNEDADSIIEFDVRINGLLEQADSSEICLSPVCMQFY